MKVSIAIALMAVLAAADSTQASKQVNSSYYQGDNGEIDTVADDALSLAYYYYQYSYYYGRGERYSSSGGDWYFWLFFIFICVPIYMCAKCA